MSGKPVPVEIKQSGVRELRIAWSDGPVSNTHLTLQTSDLV